MKKLIPALLALILLLSFTACSPDPPEISQETLFFGNTQWGMTKAETLKALKLKEKDLEPIKDEYITMGTYRINGYKYNDAICDLIISFTTGEGTSLKADCLQSVKVVYTDEEAMKAEWKALYDTLSGKNSAPLYTTRWASTKTFKDYAIDNGIPFEEMIYYDPNIDYDRDKFTEEEMGEKLDNLPLAELSANIKTKSQESEYIAEIVFNGGAYAYATSFKK